jgi:hypothetical protein
VCRLWMQPDRRRERGDRRQSRVPGRHPHRRPALRPGSGARVGARHEPGGRSRSSRMCSAPTTASPRRTARTSLAHGVTALNLVSSPGSGKTTLLCATIEALRGRARSAGGGDRGRPADLLRRRPHPRHRRAGDPGQHRQGLPPRRADGGRGLRACRCTGTGSGMGMTRVTLMARRPRPRRAAVHRERRQPGLPGDVGPGRGGQGGHPVGDRGRGQAAKYPDMFAAAR